MQTIEKIVEIPLVQTVEKVEEIPQVGQTTQGTTREVDIPLAPRREDPFFMVYYVLAFKRLKKECWRGAPGPSGSAGRGPKAFGATWNLLSTPLECSRLQI